jgi:hypothetical protein
MCGYATSRTREFCWLTASWIPYFSFRQRCGRLLASYQSKTMLYRCAPYKNTAACSTGRVPQGTSHTPRPQVGDRECRVLCSYGLPHICPILICAGFGGFGGGQMHGGVAVPGEASHLIYRYPEGPEMPEYDWMYPISDLDGLPLSDASQLLVPLLLCRTLTQVRPPYGYSVQIYRKGHVDIPETLHPRLTCWLTQPSVILHVFTPTRGHTGTSSGDIGTTVTGANPLQDASTTMRSIFMYPRPAI